MSQAQHKAAISTDISELIRLAENFGILLLKETEALRENDFALVETLQADKKNLADRYNHAVKDLYIRKEEFTGLDLSLRERLVIARTKFTAILSNNMQALEIAKDSTNRLSHRILETVRQTVMQDTQTNYSAKGHAQSFRTASLSLNIDERL